MKLKTLLPIVLIMAWLFVGMAMAQDGNGDPNYVFPAAVMAVVGAFAPLIIGWIVRQVPQGWARYLISMVISGAFGVAGILIFSQIAFTLENVALIVPAFIKWSDTAYRLWWHNILKG